MNLAGSRSERFSDPSTEGQESALSADEVASGEPVFEEQPPPMPSPLPLAAPTLPPSSALPPLNAQPTPPPGPALEATMPLPSLASPAVSPQAAAPGETRAISVFRIDGERLMALQDLTWQRLRALLWAIIVGAALGLLLLLPAVHALPPVAHPAKSLVGHPPTPQRPFWAFLLLLIGFGGPLLALALGVVGLPLLLWRVAWLRRQQSLHLAIGRQGLLFFLPGEISRWFLLPWEHITALTDATTSQISGRQARLRTVLWRRWARLQRAFRRGGRLGKEPGQHKPVRSPFLLRVRAAGPQARLRVVCYARLPDSGYSWLFRLAPFTRRVGATTFLLNTGWFESAASPGVSPQRVLLGLWTVPPARAQRVLLPLPRAQGAVLLNAPAPSQEVGTEARRVDYVAWAALPLVPALSVMVVLIALVTRQPPTTGTVLNMVALCILTLGLGLLLAGTRWPTQGQLFVGGAFLLALAGALNLVYAVVALLHTWPWAFQTAPNQPFFFLEALASLLLILGGAALGLEGSGRPGLRAMAPQSAGTELNGRPHNAELVVALGLLLLGLARVLEDIDLAALSSSAATLAQLRNTLAEPLLPLAIIGLSYFAPLVGSSLQSFFRTLQAVYGGVLGLLVPAAFIFVYRANGGTRPVPLEWLPLLVVELLCGLLVVTLSLLAQRRGDPLPWRG